MEIRILPYSSLAPRLLSVQHDVHSVWFVIDSRSHSSVVPEVPNGFRCNKNSKEDVSPP